MNDRYGHAMNRRIRFPHAKDYQSVLAEIRRNYGDVETATMPDPDGHGFFVFWRAVTCPDCCTAHGALPCPARDSE